MYTELPAAVPIDQTRWIDFTHTRALADIGLEDENGTRQQQDKKVTLDL